MPGRHDLIAQRKEINRAKHWVFQAQDRDVFIQCDELRRQLAKARAALEAADRRVDELLRTLYPYSEG